MTISAIQEACSRGITKAKDAEVTDIAIDIETLGTKPGAPIVAIGMAAFSRVTGEVYPIYYATIDVVSSVDYSTGIEAETVKWWLRQGPEEIDMTFNTPATTYPLYDVLAQVNDIFAYLATEGGVPKPWGNGASFDISLLEATYSAAMAEVPWKYWDARDVRTIVDICEAITGINHKKKLPFEGTKHNAFFDAVHQARYTAQSIQELAKIKNLRNNNG